jgi:uncharacterized protein YbjT (DUF2867 family)
VTGFTGSQLLRLLVFLNERKNANITVYALARDTNKVEKIFPGLDKHGKIHFVISDIKTMPAISVPIDYIIPWSKYNIIKSIC